MLHLHAVPEPVAALLLRLSSCGALNRFALGGGTSLALRFGHRISVDLDYFTPEEFQPDMLAESLDLDGATVLSVAKNSLRLVSAGVKIDLLRHAYPEVAPIDTIEGHRLISIPDLAAMKLNAITNRGSKKDFYDLSELLHRHSLDEMLRFFGTKYPATDPFAVIRSLAWFDDAEHEPDPIPLAGQIWDDVKERIIHALRGL
jgi:predicted nucleotidyltransferase component of viral defense system